MLGEISNITLNDLSRRLAQVKADQEFYKHQYDVKMHQFSIEERKLELMIEIEHLNNDLHRELTKC